MKSGISRFTTVLLAFGGLALLITAAGAQTFINSATLAASVDGTNLVISYSMTTTQGWVTLFSASRPDQLSTAAQPVDLVQVPPSQNGEFRATLDPAAPVKFYRLLIEQWPSRGKVLVFTNGPLDFAAMRAAYGDITNNAQHASFPEQPTNTTPMIFKTPVGVWLD